MCRFLCSIFISFCKNFLRNHSQRLGHLNNELSLSTLKIKMDRQRIKLKMECYFKTLKLSKYVLKLGPPRYQADMLPTDLSWLGLIFKLTLKQMVTHTTFLDVRQWITATLICILTVKHPTSRFELISHLIVCDSNNNTLTNICKSLGRDRSMEVIQGKEASLVQTI